MRADLKRLEEEVAARQTRGRQALTVLATATLVAAVVLTVSILLVNHPPSHRARWALPGALYAGAVFITVVGLVRMWRKRRRFTSVTDHSLRRGCSDACANRRLDS